jgi:hypothetical protein
MRPMTLRTVASLLLLSCTLSLLPGGTAGAATPRLNLKPSHGLPGETIVATGRNFVPGATGTVIWTSDGSELATFQADDDGDFSVEFIVPDAEPGDYGIAAVTPDEAAADRFELEPPDVDTTEAEEESAASVLEPMPEWMIAAKPAADPHACPAGLTGRVHVATADELTAAGSGFANLPCS